MQKKTLLKNINLPFFLFAKEKSASCSKKKNRLFLSLLIQCSTALRCALLEPNEIGEASAIKDSTLYSRE